MAQMVSPSAEIAGPSGIIIVHLLADFMHIVNKLVVLVQIYEWLLSTPNFWSPAGPIGQTGPGSMDT